MGKLKAIDAEFFKDHTETYANIDEFSKKFLEEILKKMKDANAELKKHISQSMENQDSRSKHEDKIKELINAGLVSKNASAVNEVKDFLEKRKTVDDLLVSLMGLVRLNISLEKRLAVFIELFDEYQKISLANPSREQLLKLFAHYGKSLGLLWNVCQPICVDVFAGETFEEVIFGKKHG
ncbi:MAG: hypothetical protein HRU09_11725 [Oligoflexales bacterium]|nr:hypothetical protein [Oligoflexales bacterium]